MDVGMHDGTETIKVKVSDYPSDKKDRSSFDLYTIRFRQTGVEITLFFRDLDHLVDLTRSLSLQVSDLRHSVKEREEG